MKNKILAKVLIVDDTAINVDILIDLLDDIYDVVSAPNGEIALSIVEKMDIELILLDIMMPNLNGYEVCTQLKLNPKTKNIPVIFITTNTDENSISQAYEAGGIDYVVKPFRAKEVLARVDTHLKIYQQQHELEVMQNLLKGENTSLELCTKQQLEEISNLNNEILQTQKEVIFTMGAIGEFRSKETGYHVKRVAKYCKVLALGYGLGEEEANSLSEASPMHDIGKIAIPDSILNKPGKHTEEEFEIMKTHAHIGYQMLQKSKQSLLKTAAIVAHEHHEKWNGQGYPRGLKEKDIHVYGRIVALADVFDALGSDRVYKKAWKDENIFQLIKDEKGKHFDPDIVDIFFTNLDEILEIRDSLKDDIL